MRSLTVLIAVIWVNMAAAGPDRSERPQMRPDGLVTLNPGGSIEVAPRNPAGAAVAAQRGKVVKQSLRPESRTRRVKRVAREQERLRRRGAVCGDLDIQGERMAPFQGRVIGCGITEPVRIRAVSGVGLTQQSLMDCNTAKALKSWIDNTAKPTLARTGGGLAQLQVAAHYVCKTRNSRPGARLSEHAKGRAIDISGVKMRDGSVITVRNGWNAAGQRDVMRRLHRGACGPFGTVLGPASDRFHQGHFHFDTAKHRGGPYCR